jgi:hypothetical protein
MTDSAVAADFDQAFNIQSDFPAKITFDLAGLIDKFSDPADLIFSQVAHSGVGIDSGLGQDFLGS